MRKRSICVLCLIAVFSVISLAEAKRSATNLPYRFQQMDPFGNAWMIYNGGRLMQQGNMPFCSDAAGLTINNQGLAANAQTAMIDPNGDVVIDGIRTNQFTVTRRFNQGDDGVLRIVDIIHNSRPQEATVTVAMTFNINFGVQSTRQLSDSRKPDKTLANIVTDSQGRNGISIYAGRGGKVTPTINAQPNNSQVQAVYEVKVPANKDVAIVTFHQVGVTTDQAEKLYGTLRETRAIASLPPEIRKLVVNYGVSTGVLDDVELLRGTTTDVVELTNGDQLRGDLLPAKWEVETAFGKVQVPNEQVVAMIVTRGLAQRQLLVTSDGEMIGGKLTSPMIEFQIASGQKLSLPISQISRLGKRAGATDANPTTRPYQAMLQLRTGDRLAIVPPQQPLKVATRFGTLALAAQGISSLDMQPEQSPVHMVTLTDGSRFSGLLLADTLEFVLVRGEKVTIPLAMIRKVSFAAETDTDTEAPASLRLNGDDVLTASLPSKIALVTTYGDVSIIGPEVKRIARAKEGADDVQFTLWDDSVISGRLAQPFLECAIAGNTVAKVPIGIIDQYVCNAPQPSANMVDRIRKLVTELNADDWKQRERAEADLIGMGPGIAASLKQVRAGQPPEAQQRIDSILKQLTKGGSKGSAVPVGPGVPAFLPQGE